MQNMMRKPKEEPKKKSISGINQSLDKGLHLLEVVQQFRYPVTLRQLWASLRWDKATIFRLLRTLEYRGYISRNSEQKTYTLGLKIYGLYDSLIRELDVQQIARPLLEKLVNETGQTAHLAVVLDKSVVFIDKVVASEMLAVNTQVGSRQPMHCTALGKATLAFVDEPEIVKYLEVPLCRYTPKTICTLEGLAAELNRIRRRGYAIDDEEYIAGVRCIASPIVNQHGEPVAVLGISGPKGRISMREPNKYGGLIRRYSRDISKRLGYLQE
jgi:DNA-binding IclR family transcriptional regulator